MEIDKLMTPRFYAISKLVPECETVADIGTDHAYIPVYLLKNGICKKAIAMDLREGPLKRAEATVLRFDVSEKTELRLSNGLEALAENEADVIVIAGMGGLLINEILKANAKKHKNALFVLQPMTAEEEVRRFLEKNGYLITDEVLAKEDNKLYTVMCAKHGEMKIENELHYYIGKKLFENKDPLLSVMIKKLKNKHEAILKGLKLAKGVSEEKKDFSEKMLLMLKEAEKGI